MTVYYNAQDRKPLVKAISEFTGTKAVYMKTPIFYLANEEKAVVTVIRIIYGGRDISNSKGGHFRYSAYHRRRNKAACCPCSEFAHYHNINCRCNS